MLAQRGINAAGLRNNYTWSIVLRNSTRKTLLLPPQFLRPILSTRFPRPNEKMCIGTRRTRGRRRLLSAPDRIQIPTKRRRLVRKEWSIRRRRDAGHARGRVFQHAESALNGDEEGRGDERTRRRKRTSCLERRETRRARSWTDAK